MEFTLKNEKASLTVSSLAAEVISFKKNDGDEMIWDRNKEDWHNCNPILFPIFGPLKDGKYEYDGKEYSFGQHGFLRRSEFKFEEIKKDELTLSFQSDEDSLKVYPFKFKMTVNYKLIEDKVILSYKVDNLDEKQLPFEIGFHPAFNCSNVYDEDFKDWYVEFEKEEDWGKKLPLSDFVNEESSSRFFYDGHNSDYVDVRNNKKGIRVCIKGFSTLGFWHKSPNARFICIEPIFPANDLNKDNFFGRDDKTNNLLPVGQSYSCSYYWQLI